MTLDKDIESTKTAQTYPLLWSRFKFKLFLYSGFST